MSTMIRTLTLPLLAFLTIAAAVPGVASAARYMFVYAIDGNGKLGIAAGTDNIDQLRRDAIHSCGGGCQIVLESPGPCVAYAEAHSGGYWHGNAVAETRSVAEALALGFCNKSGAPGCEIMHSQCRL